MDRGVEGIVSNFEGIVINKERGEVDEKLRVNNPII